MSWSFDDIMRALVLVVFNAPWIMIFGAILVCLLIFFVGLPLFLIGQMICSIMHRGERQ